MLSKFIDFYNINRNFSLLSNLSFLGVCGYIFDVQENVFKNFIENKNFLHSTNVYNFFIVLYFYFFFNILNDLVGIDNMKSFDKKKAKGRFQLWYNMLSTFDEINLNLNIHWDFELKLFTIEKLYSNANWLEREAWDLFGVFFSGHSDLRRILTDYGFSGFPFRCDFPVVGFSELEYNSEIKDLVYVPVSLSQEDRCFEFDDDNAYIF